MISKTLLCVEKGDKAAEGRWAALESAGYKVIVTDSASEALKVFVSQTIGAVLLGSEFANGKKQSLRGQMSSIRPQVPVIAIVGQHQPTPARSFTHVFRKRDGTRRLLRILEGVLAGRPLRHRRSAGA